jgi:hypothetical protein
MMKMQQLLLDTIARLPELEILDVWIPDDLDPQAWKAGLANFKPNPELRYVEELWILYIGVYVLEKDRELPVRYRAVE